MLKISELFTGEKKSLYIAWACFRYALVKRQIDKTAPANGHFWVSLLSFLRTPAVRLCSHFSIQWSYFKQTEYPQLGRRDLHRHIWAMLLV